MNVYLDVHIVLIRNNCVQRHKPVLLARPNHNKINENNNNNNNSSNSISGIAEWQHFNAK